MGIGARDMQSRVGQSTIPNLQIAIDDIDRECDEAAIYTSRLPLVGARVLELGCGAAQHTIAIADLDRDIEVTALEVDQVQHEKNLRSINVPNITFKLAGAEAIPELDASFDIVMMFKSLHHVPLDNLGQAFGEIHRVLKPGGLAYISEPIFAGAFNEILRLFHDEQAVRRAAFNAICDAVATGQFELVDQIFFCTPTNFVDFAEFEAKIIKATHSEHRLSAEVFDQVKARMEEHMGADGIRFRSPMRIDLLRKPIK